jgi:uncharacterized membrane protein
MESFALFFHVLGAFLFVSGATVAGIAFEAARRHEAPAEIAALLGLARQGAALLGAGVVLVLAFGLWLVHLGHWGYGAGWVDGASGLFVLALFLGALGGQAPKHARLLASCLAEQGQQASEELRNLLDDRRALAVNYASGLLVIAIVVLMVWKPGA